MFTPFIHKVLKSVDRFMVYTVLKKFEQYELEVPGKQNELPNLSLVPCTSCIDRLLLEQLIMLGKLDTFAPNTTHKQLSCS